MRKLRLFGICLTIFLFLNALAFGGPTPPSMLGTWTGSGADIYPNGTIDEYSITLTVTHQTGQLFSGSLERDDNGTSTTGTITGFVSSSGEVKAVFQVSGGGDNTYISGTLNGKGTELTWVGQAETGKTATGSLKR